MKARAIWVAAVASVTISVVLLLSGCAASGGIRRPETISMPVSLGWYNGERVYYITTDITDPPMARGDIVRELKLLSRWSEERQTITLPSAPTGLRSAVLVQVQSGGPILAAAET
jgi:hypothetical protein